VLALPSRNEEVERREKTVKEQLTLAGHARSCKRVAVLVGWRSWRCDSV
jgi:hypothetical protein